MNNERASFSLRKCIVVFLISCFILTGITLLLNQNWYQTGDETEQIHDWQYTFSRRLSDLGMRGKEWFSANRENPIAMQKVGEYILVRGEVPKTNAFDSLCIRTANNVLSVKADGKVIFDSLSGNHRFASNRVNIIPLSDFSGNRTVEITMYVPLSFELNAFLANKATVSKNSAPIPYLDWCIAIVCLLLGGTILLLALIHKHKKAAVFMAITCLLSGIAILVNPFYTHVFFLNSSSLWFRIGMTIYSLIPVFVLLSVFVGRIKWNTQIEGLIGINILYAISVACSPYEILSMFLLQINCVLQVINLIMFFYLIWRFGVSITPLSAGVYLAFSVFNVIFWYSLPNHGASVFGLCMLIAAVGFACVSFISIVQMPQQAKIKDKTRKTEKGDVQSLPIEVGNALDEVIRLAITAPQMKTVLRENNYEISLVHALDDKNFYNTIRNLVMQKCDGSTHHLLHIAEYTHIMCLEIGFSIERADFIARASLLHDIGKILVPYHILFKVDALTGQEFKEIKRHTQYGFDMLDGSEEETLVLAAQIAREHHERFNGSGYIGLKGNEINYCAHIVAIADVFDALTAKRAYKKVWDFDQAVDYIKEQRGIFFDPEITDAFAACSGEIRKAFDAFRETEYEAPDITDDSLMKQL